MSEIFLPAIRKHGGGEGGEHRTAYFYDALLSHDCLEALAFYKKHKLDRFRIHAAFSWKFRMIDVAVATQVKAECAEQWCQRECMKQQILHKKSRNYKAPTKADAICWSNIAWDKITEEHITNACKKCYMDPKDLDGEMAVIDDRYDVFAEK